MGLAGSLDLFTDDWLVLLVREPWHGEDLNGDNDTEDLVVHVCDLSAVSVKAEPPHAERPNPRLAAPGARHSLDAAVPRCLPYAGY